MQVMELIATHHFSMFAENWCDAVKCLADFGLASVGGAAGKTMTLKVKCAFVLCCTRVVYIINMILFFIFKD